ncbi:MAG: putative transcription regulator, contains HTH domain (MarR family) [Rhodobacteraceae bacterium HLUCCA12]|nr:MAG: putative transcription regulator, contains HTH domain (MarR family) [Rhodobacteraceae bacterium HLUCCA12]
MSSEPSDAEHAGKPPTQGSRADGRRLDERDWAEFEYALWQLGGAFARWRREGLASVSELNLNGTEAAILHVVHMNGVPKGIMEISRLLHRDDLPNLQYGLKKLQQLGLVAKLGASRKMMNYDVTDKGRKIVESFLRQRRDTLLTLLEHVANLPEELRYMITRMHLLTGIYDQSSDLVRTHQP